MLFWKDKWCGLMALCDAFPNLFVVVVAQKDVVIKEMWSSDERGGSREVGGRKKIGFSLSNPCLKF